MDETRGSGLPWEPDECRNCGALRRNHPVPAHGIFEGCSVFRGGETDANRGSGLPENERIAKDIAGRNYLHPNAVETLTHWIKEALDRKDADKRGSQQRRIEMQQEEIAALEERNAEFRKSEKELSDSYLRIRTLVNAFDTNRGGKNRFEVTEKKITELKAERDLLRERNKELLYKNEQLNHIQDAVADRDINRTIFKLESENGLLREKARKAEEALERIAKNMETSFYGTRALEEFAIEALAEIRKEP